MPHSHIVRTQQRRCVIVGQNVEILCEDFAVQLSMFFNDPDGNEVHIARPHYTARRHQRTGRMAVVAFGCCTVHGYGVHINSAGTFPRKFPTMNTKVEVTTWDCVRDDTCSRFGRVRDDSIRGDGQVATLNDPKL